MLLKFALIIVAGLALKWICQKIKVPPLIAYILLGIVLGPSVGNVLNAEFLSTCADVNTIALIIILMRAGLSLSLSDLKKVGRPAVLMCFVPATFEIIGTIVLAPKLLGISIAESAMLGAVPYLRP